MKDEGSGGKSDSILIPTPPTLRPLAPSLMLTAPATTVFKEWAGYLKPEDISQLQSAYHFSEAAHEGQYPQVGRAVHLAPARGSQHPRAVASRPAGAHRGAAARRNGRHLGHQDRDLQALRQAGRGARGRRLQARPDRVRDPRGSAGREFPQDAAGDGARRARHPDQARRPPAQHAHARRGRARAATPHRARDARDLRADRQSAGPEQHLPGTRGPRFLAPLSRPLPRAGEGGERVARQPPRGGRQGDGRDEEEAARRAGSKHKCTGARSTSTPSTARCGKSTSPSPRCSTSSVSASS